MVLFVLNLAIMCWVMMEGYFRFIYDASDPFIALQTHRMWYERNVKLNDFGFRDDIDYASLKGNDHIVFLFGDSFQWGQGVKFKDTLTSHLRGNFSKHNIMNLSILGWSTLDEFRALTQIVAAGYRPKIVVLNYNMTDIDNKGKKAAMAIGRERMHALHSLRFSYSMQNIYSRIINVMSNGQDSYAGLLSDSYKGSMFNGHKNVLLKFIRFTRTIGARCLFVIWPALPVQDETVKELNSARNLVVKVFNEGHVDYIDLYPKLLSLDRKSQTANKFDMHPSATVHGIAAEAIAGWILDTNKSDNRVPTEM